MQLKVPVEQRQRPLLGRGVGSGQAIKWQLSSSVSPSSAIATISAPRRPQRLRRRPSRHRGALFQSLVAASKSPAASSSSVLFVTRRFSELFSICLY